MKKNMLWWMLLLGFIDVNVYALVAGDIAGLVAYFRNLGPWGILATTDLLIALGIGVYWMWVDARAKGITPLPYAILTVASGSLGLLIYLVRRGMPRRSVA